MSHKHKKKSHHRNISKSREWMKIQGQIVPEDSAGDAKPKIDVVLKCDSAGCVEAVTDAVIHTAPPEMDIKVIHSGVGDINTSDIMMAETGSRLVIGFQVDVLHGLEYALKEHNVEVRLYDVIYKLIADLKNIAGSIVLNDNQDEIIGSAKVIALFKSSRKGIIIGCEVQDGQLITGKEFRIISAMGPVYSGRIESMHIEQNVVQKAVRGQRAGIKIKDFKRVKIGDLVECFQRPRSKKAEVWRPTGDIIRK